MRFGLPFRGGFRVGSGRFGQRFRIATLPPIEIVSGDFSIAGSDDPLVEGSTVTLTDTLIFDPTPDSYTVTLQERFDGGPWEPVAHDITAAPFVVPADPEGMEYRVRAVAEAAGFRALTLVSNILAAAPIGESEALYVDEDYYEEGYA